MVRFCPECATQITDDQTIFCKVCGTQLSKSISLNNKNDRSFHYSFLFYLVVISDLFFSGILGFTFIILFFDSSNINYHSGLGLIWGLIFLVSFFLDLILLLNIRKTPQSIDIELCWFKAIFGILGIITLLSGSYFAIVSYRMHSAHKKEMNRKKQGIALKKNEVRETEDIEKLQEYNTRLETARFQREQEEKNRIEREKEENKLKKREEWEEFNRLEKERYKKEQEEKERKKREENQRLEEIITELEETNTLFLIDNYVKLYPDRLSGTSEFNNLQELLKTKKYPFSNDDLESIIRIRFGHKLIEEFKRKLLQKNPTSTDDVLRQYIEFYGADSDLKYIPFLRHILAELFDYKEDVLQDLHRVRREVELKKFESHLLSDTSNGSRLTIKDIDNISGYDFEKVLKELFKKMGYQVIHTKLSNDQGADLIVEKFGEKTVIQAKNWQNNVTNSGIQEVVAAINHYHAHKAMVISSSGFTSAAIDLARSNKVELWDRQKLRNLLNEYPISRK